MISGDAFSVLAFLFPEVSPSININKQIWDTLKAGDPNLLTYLRLNGLTPLIYLQLVGQKRHQDLPPGFLHEFHRDYASALKTASWQARFTFQILRSLNKANVYFILLKGADLRLRVYQDPAQRPMSDLDILISQDQLPLTWQALAHLGYRLSPLLTEPRHGVRELFENELMFERSSGEGLAVDVHWEIRAVVGFYRLPFSVLKERATSFEFQGAPVNLLIPEHAIIHLCLHLLNDSFEAADNPNTTSQIVDLVLSLINFQIDWSLLLREVSRFNCQAPVCLVLRQLQRLFPHLIPSEVVEELACYRPTFIERLLLSRRLGYLSNYITLFHHHSCRDWYQFLAAKFWPDPEYLIATLGKADRRLYVHQFLKKLAGNDSL